MPAVRLSTIERKPRFGSLAARLNPQDELRVEKGLPAVVQQQGIDTVAEGIIHTRSDKHIFIAIGIEIADAKPPRPVVFNADLIGYFAEVPAAQIAVERIAEDAVPAAQEKILGVRAYRLLASPAPVQYPRSYPSAYR